MALAENPIVWENSRDSLEKSALWAFKAHLEAKHFVKFANYGQLHNWSTKYYLGFWRELLTWSTIIFEGVPDQIYIPDPFGKLYGGRWFPDVKLNYAENLLANLPDTPVRAFYENNEAIAELSKPELLAAVKFFQRALGQAGIAAGDRVCALVGNNHLALIAMLATTSLGAAWSSCSPDFGEVAVLDRFTQVKPRAFLYDEATLYNGKRIALSEKIERIVAGLASPQNISLRGLWDEFQKSKSRQASFHELAFTRVPFAAPLYILFSSGTTGVPKCMIHSVGGTLLQHVKEHQLHGDVKKGERFFYYTTTGWMMWNWMVSALFAGCEIFTLEGAPIVGDWTLWNFVADHEITAFGTSARFIATCRNRAGSLPAKLTAQPPRITFSTGSPLLPEDFDYYYANVDPAHRSQLASISGGTDIVSCFMLGNPWKPVRRGEIQGAGLGMDIAAVDEQRRVVVGEEGELVCRTPFVAMPTAFLNDPDFAKYEQAYFDKFFGVWSHGDYVIFTNAGGIIVKGRSDATLNPGGVRIGTAEIYRIVEQDADVADSLVVGKSVAGDEKVVLFLKLKGADAGENVPATVAQRIKAALREKASPRHVPHYIFAVKDIPYTLSGKKVELAVKQVLKGEKPHNLEALQNPAALSEYAMFKGKIEEGLK